MAFPTNQGPALAVRGVSFSIHRGETVGLVGESGSGKTLTGLACMRLVPAAGQLAADILRFEQTDLLGTPEPALRTMRGARIAMVPQDPFTSLHPSLTIGAQINDALTDHGVRSGLRRERILRGLQRVGLPDPERLSRRYPHELSGGMRQRAVIALALANAPSLVIADEPTTALDAVIQAQILRLLAELRSSLRMGMLLISHNLGVVGGICDRLLVMYAGRIVESGRTAEVLKAPMHPYTEALLDAVPRLHSRHRLVGIPGAPPSIWDRPRGCPFHPRCALRLDRCSVEEPPLASAGLGRLAACWLNQGFNAPFAARTRSAAPPHPVTDPTAASRTEANPPLYRLRGVAREFRTGPAWHRDIVHAVDDISVEIHRGEALGIVGESGSGKSTLIRLLALLDRPTRGSISYHGEVLSRLHGAELLDFRRRVQIVFQDPYASLDPRYAVADSIREALRTHRICARHEENSRIRDALDKVGLSLHFAELYPRQLSGGQRQRVCIARALAVRPEVLLADEPVSALDVSIQAQMIELFDNLRRQENLTFVVVAHDLALIRQVSERVITLYLGRIVEDAPTDDYAARPLHPYSFALAQSIPDPDRTGSLPPVIITTEAPSSVHRPSGCHFHPRCFRAESRCGHEHPQLTQNGPQHKVACFYPMTDGHSMEAPKGEGMPVGLSTSWRREGRASINTGQNGAE